MTNTKIEVPTEIGWQTLLSAVWKFVQQCHARELAAGDADKLEVLARTIRLRLMEGKR